MSKTYYYKTDFFYDEFSRLKKEKAWFLLSKTSFTKKIKGEGYAMMFNPEGKGDDRVLSLINKVRGEGQKFLSLTPNLGNGNIDYFNLFEIPNEDELIFKVDVNSAYWQHAILKKVISDESNDLLNKLFSDEPYKVLKEARLKALGSLATRKEFEEFQEGVSTDYYIKEEITKPLYIDICRGIDDLMKKCKHEVPGCVYYYWDCMFLKKGFEKRALEFFVDNKYTAKLGQTKLDYMKIGDIGYLVSESDGKMYMTKRENRELLPNIK